MMKRLWFRGAVKIRLAAYRALHDEPPLTVFEPPARWGENKICRIWRVEVANNGRRSIGGLNVLISGRGQRCRLPVDRKRLGFLETDAPSIDLHRHEFATVEVAFAPDSKVSHDGFGGMTESEMGICLFGVSPPCNLLSKARWEAGIEVRGAGLRPVERNVVFYPNEENDLVLEFELRWFAQLLRAMKARLPAFKFSKPMVQGSLAHNR